MDMYDAPSSSGKEPRTPPRYPRESFREPYRADFRLRPEEEVSQELRPSPPAPRGEGLTRIQNLELLKAYDHRSDPMWLVLAPAEQEILSVFSEAAMQRWSKWLAWDTLTGNQRAYRTREEIRMAFKEAADVNQAHLVTTLSCEARRPGSRLTDLVLDCRASYGHHSRKHVLALHEWRATNVVNRFLYPEVPSPFKGARLPPASKTRTWSSGVEGKRRACDSRWFRVSFGQSGFANWRLTPLADPSPLSYSDALQIPSVPSGPQSAFAERGDIVPNPRTLSQPVAVTSQDQTRPPYSYITSLQSGVASKSTTLGRFILPRPPTTAMAANRSFSRALSAENKPPGPGSLGATSGPNRRDCVTQNAPDLLVTREPQVIHLPGTLSAVRVRYKQAFREERWAETLRDMSVSRKIEAVIERERETAMDHLEHRIRELQSRNALSSAEHDLYVRGHTTMAPFLAGFKPNHDWMIVEKHNSSTEPLAASCISRQEVEGSE